jgi:hypothetical protein
MCDDLCECDEIEYIKEDDVRQDYEDWEIDPEMGCN